jgi:hypothetical protein
MTYLGLDLVNNTGALVVRRVDVRVLLLVVGALDVAGADSVSELVVVGSDTVIGGVEGLPGRGDRLVLEVAGLEKTEKGRSGRGRMS